MKRNSWIMAMIGVVAAAAIAWFLYWSQPKLPKDLMSVVPADAYGAVRIRMARVLGSAAFKRLVVERGEARGLERVTKTCGFNPLARLKEVVVFARPAADGGAPRLAFVARGDFEPAELLTCVEKVTGSRAGQLRRETIEGVPTVASSKGTSRAAFVGQDGIVGGDAQGVRSVILALQGKAPNMLSDGSMANLFNDVEAGQDVAGVARIPDAARPHLRALSAEIMGGQLVALAEVRAVAGNLNLTHAKVTGGATLLATDRTRAAAIVTLARTHIDRVMRIPGVALTPAGDALRSIQAEARSDKVTFAAAIKVSTMEALLKLLPALAMLQDAIKKPQSAGAVQLNATHTQQAAH